MIIFKMYTWLRMFLYKYNYMMVYRSIYRPEDMHKLINLNNVPTSKNTLKYAVFRKRSCDTIHHVGSTHSPRHFVLSCLD